MTKDQIAELCEKFNAAERSGDTSSLQSLLADDFQSIGPKGFILSKRQWIERLEHSH